MDDLNLSINSLQEGEFDRNLGSQDKRTKDMGQTSGECLHGPLTKGKLKKTFVCYAPNMLLHAFSSSLVSSPASMKGLLKEFKDVFLEDIPHGLLPLRGIEHHIDLSLRATVPNKAAYRKNPKEGKEIH
ncbi:hypothetical protein CR513_33495, partial [Mucuna pruriens]